jgi:hypothetical protein
MLEKIFRYFSKPKENGTVVSTVKRNGDIKEVLKEHEGELLTIHFYPERHQIPRNHNAFDAYFLDRIQDPTFQKEKTLKFRKEQGTLAPLNGDGQHAYLIDKIQNGKGHSNNKYALDFSKKRILIENINFITDNNEVEIYNNIGIHANRRPFHNEH